MEDDEIVPMDDALIGMLSDLKRMQAQFEGALNLYLRQNKLQGAWQIAENGKLLVKVKTPQEVK